jgi:hypothetical protein
MQAKKSTTTKKSELEYSVSFYKKMISLDVFIFSVWILVFIFVCFWQSFLLSSLYLHSPFTFKVE